MPILSIIACRILEDELAHILSEDHELRHLILIDNPDSFGLSGKLRSRNRPHLLKAWEDIPEILNGINRDGHGILKPLLESSRLLCNLLRKGEGSGEEMIVVVDVLKMALHTDGKILREEVCNQIERMSQFSDGILLFYGLCGNALHGLDDQQNERCPLFFLTDDSGERADDCIAAALGGNRQYAEALSSYPGVGIFFTPMWAVNCGEMDKEARRSSKSKGLGEMLIDLGYSKIARLDTGLKFISDFEVESKINGFASSYNLEVVKLRGSAKIAESCYRQAKDEVRPSACRSKP